MSSLETMDITEKKAYNWLLTKGYTPKDIIFQKRKNPDFLTSDGKGFEAKRLRQRTLWFTSNQFEELKAVGAIILGFRDESAEPFITLQASDLKEGIVEGVRIVATKASYGEPKKRTAYDLLQGVVEACLEPTSLTDLYFKIKTTYTVLTIKLNTALRFRLIETLGEKYHTTQKGINFLNAWANVQTFLKEEF